MHVEQNKGYSLVPRQSRPMGEKTVWNTSCNFLVLPEVIMWVLSITHLGGFYGGCKWLFQVA